MSEFDKRVHRLVDKHNYPFDLACDVVWKEIEDANNTKTENNND